MMVDGFCIQTLLYWFFLIFWKLNSGAYEHLMHFPAIIASSIQVAYVLTSHYDELQIDTVTCIFIVCSYLTNLQLEYCIKQFMDSL